MNLIVKKRAKCGYVVRDIMKTVYTSALCTETRKMIPIERGQWVKLLEKCILKCLHCTKYNLINA